ncbi:alpha/beta hydrolase [Salinibacterium sp. TMP30]|uniref:alpha/beta fold hydrolase n=1 Tax=Salinibacterium sp. TMP30 TaxID=3138237 RepID=UPI0031398655
MRSSGPPSTGRPPFVLIHGIGMSHRYLTRLHNVLSEMDEVYSIDLPGFGGLPKPAKSLGVPEMARALGRVLDRLGIEQAVLVGHSMGTQWVVELAAQRPELATHVAAVGPVVDDTHRSIFTQTVALGVDALGEPTSANLLAFTDFLRCGPSWFLTQAGQMVAYPIEDRVPGLLMPLLLLRGGRDRVAGMDWCRRLRGDARSVTLVTVPGHQHFVQRTAPRAVASALHAFTRKDAPPAS